MIYKSRFSPALFIPIIMILGLSVYYCANQLWVALIVNLLICGFIGHLLMTTYYTIKENTLNVRSGFFYNLDIDITTIGLIVVTHSVLSAPALSADRIEVFYNRYDSVMISPPDKKEFIAHLQSINPNIEIRLDEKKTSK